MRASALLKADAILNLLLGALLAFFPTRLVTALGIPADEVAFYPSILGAVLFGVGIALWIEQLPDFSGLGLAGAIAINLSGGVALAAWLLFGSLSLPLRGRLLLWALVVALVGLSLLELRAPSGSRAERVD